ncbi:hypothetical protein SDRG_10639, partial [Saprolegnia diclina VS20]
MTRSVLDIADVFVTIFQYAPSHRDVISFLRALPPVLVTPPLAALLELLQLTMRRTPALCWPRPCLSAVIEANIDRFVSAMPTFTSVCIDTVSISHRCPTYIEASE